MLKSIPPRFFVLQANFDEPRFVVRVCVLDTGHPEAANQLVSDNVKEMSNPTRDGRAMIAAGLIHPDARSTSAPVSPAPNVTTGAVHVSNRPASSAGGSQNSPIHE
jgi:hypothetical protein